MKSKYKYKHKHTDKLSYKHQLACKDVHKRTHKHKHKHELKALMQKQNTNTKTSTDDDEAHKQKITSYQDKAHKTTTFTDSWSRSQSRSRGIYFTNASSTKMNHHWIVKQQQNTITITFTIKQACWPTNMQPHTYILCVCVRCMRKRTIFAFEGPRSTYITTRDTYDSGRTLIQTSADKQTTRLQGTHKHRQPKHKYNRKQKAVHENSHKQIWKERIGLFCVRGKCNRRCKATHENRQGCAIHASPRITKHDLTHTTMATHFVFQARMLRMHTKHKTSRTSQSPVVARQCQSNHWGPSLAHNTHKTRRPQ
jgi:hypothetical protein